MRPLVRSRPPEPVQRVDEQHQRPDGDEGPDKGGVEHSKRNPHRHPGRAHREQRSDATLIDRLTRRAHYGHLFSRASTMKSRTSRPSLRSAVMVLAS